ncbi:cathelicidin-related peptide Pt_CRAMP2-like [Rhynchocyon petersi]
MECTRMSALLLLLLGLTWAEPPSLPKDVSLSYTEALELAINSYNNELDNEEEYAFRVLEAEPQPDWDPTLSEPQSLDFTIKETECTRLENVNPEKCPFQDKGQVNNCLGIITSDKKINMAITCEPQKSAEPIRERRGLKKKIKKVKKKLGKVKGRLLKKLPKELVIITLTKTL